MVSKEYKDFYVVYLPDHSVYEGHRRNEIGRHFSTIFVGLLFFLWTIGHFAGNRVGRVSAVKKWKIVREKFQEK